MLSGARPIDAALAARFETARSTDAEEFTASSRISDRLPGTSHEYEYRLRDRALWRMRFEDPIFALADRGAGAMGVCLATNRFCTEVSLSGDEGSVFVVALPSQGTMTLLMDGAATIADERGGLVIRPSARARVITATRSGGTSSPGSSLAQTNQP